MISPSTNSICMIIFSVFVSTTLYPTNPNNKCAAFYNDIDKNYKIKHQINGTLKKALKHVKIRGASDFVVIKRLPEGTLASSPLFVHFGSGIFAGRSAQRPRAEGFRVAMAVNGQTVEGMALRADQKGIVHEPRPNVSPLIGFLRGNGRHSVRFSLQDWKGRTVGVDCSLYYWDSASKLVVSDIDGTVTKSDLWGMILGKAWIQRDVRSLYRRIKQRGYKIVYLSARPASVGTLTRQFLKRRLKMPSGPLLLSPEPLGKALKTATKDPQRIKIICMQRLKDLYSMPRTDRRHFGRKRSEMRRNPLFAAFGNQPSDRLAYDALSVPSVFMVTPRGTVTVYRNGGASVEKGRSYGYVIAHMDGFFPRLA